MPRDSNGVFTLPSSVNPVVTGTTIDPSWANPTMADMAQGVSDSLDRYGRGGMLAVFKVLSGTPAAPGLSFNVETTTGLSLPAAGEMVISVGGTEVARFKVADITFAKPLKYAADPASANELTRKSWVDTQLATKFDKAGGTISGSATITGNAVISGTLNVTGAVSGPVIFQAGQNGSGLGGNFRSLGDDGVLKWAMGILGSPGARSWSVYDVVRAVSIITGNATTGELTIPGGIAGMPPGAVAGDAVVYEQVTPAVQADAQARADAAEAAALAADAVLKTLPSAGAALVSGEVYEASTGFTLNTGLTAGNVYNIYNTSISFITITQGAGLTLRWAGASSTGNRTLYGNGMAVVWVRSSTEYIISGAGVA